MSNIEKRIATERKLVRKLVREMKARGWAAVTVDDGDENVRVRTEGEVLDAVFAVDVSRIRFRKGERKAWADIVLGNDGWDAIADNSCSPDDDFGTIMQEVIDPYVDRLADEA